jgi:hypothetical protein
VHVIEAYLDRVNVNVAGWAASWVLVSAVLMFWPSAAARGSRKGRWQWHDNDNAAPDSAPNAAPAQPAADVAEGGAK